MKKEKSKWSLEKAFNAIKGGNGLCGRGAIEALEEAFFSISPSIHGTKTYIHTNPDYTYRGSADNMAGIGALLY